MALAKTILLVNGSCGGPTGNTAELLEVAAQCLASRISVSRLVLNENTAHAERLRALRECDGFIFGTGTYWDSWGSALQRFFEEMTPTEGSDLWLGKPAAVVVTMHSVGGKGVLSRLQGVLNTFGAVIPPMSGLVYSTVNHVALGHGESELTDDLWRPDDLKVVCHNLVEACHGGSDWRSWPTDRVAFERKWYEKQI
jgi:multimeric flavodoxin WrbA